MPSHGHLPAQQARGLCDAEMSPMTPCRVPETSLAAVMAGDRSRCLPA